MFCTVCSFLYLCGCVWIMKKESFSAKTERVSVLIYPDLHKYTVLAGIIFKFHFLCSPLKSWVHPAHTEIFLETLSMETGLSFFLVCTNPPISSIINPNHLCSHGILSWNSFPRSLLRPQHTEKTYFNLYFPKFSSFLHRMTHY